jgi:hypothetical protein
VKTSIHYYTLEELEAKLQLVLDGLLNPSSFDELQVLIREREWMRAAIKDIRDGKIVAREETR